jgi:single-strand DNA-binding protein
MNSLNATGNISKDAVLKFTPKGNAVLEFNFALNSGYGDTKVTTWLNCSVWGKRAETLAPMLLRGTLIGITGEFLARPYTNKEGVEKLSLECRVNDVTLLGKKEAVQNVPQDEPSQGKMSEQEFDDAIPF